jgi:hypothetical protein
LRARGTLGLATGARAAADKGRVAGIATFIVVGAAAEAAQARPAATGRAAAAVRCIATGLATAGVVATDAAATEVLAVLGTTGFAAAGMVAADLIGAAGVVAADAPIAGAAERLLEAAGVAGAALGRRGAKLGAAGGDPVGADAIEAVAHTALAIPGAGTPVRLELALADVVATGRAGRTLLAQLAAGATLVVGGPAQTEPRVAGPFVAAAVRDPLFGAEGGIALAVAVDAPARQAKAAAAAAAIRPTRALALRHADALAVLACRLPAGAIHARLAVRAAGLFRIARLTDAVGATARAVLWGAARDALPVLAC